ncbi:LigA protein [Actinomadura verrucosospora]|uniref:LigA protein n=1 Tax=Actinomadura verrucosospora TaxID=46165 RepID=A0A7D3W5Z3_ACTVE|nr:LigA protein [Actinomadura verrucosospora]
MSGNPVHRSILAVDLENSTGALRTNPIKEELRSQIYGQVKRAMASAGIEERWCDPFEDRGDGVLALFHPVDELPKTYLLSRLVPSLARQLADYNESISAAERPGRCMRLRAVVHAGEIHRDENGPFGEAIDLACRLLDAPTLKKCLRASSAPLVLAVSEDIYWGIVKHGYDGISPSAYRPDLRVSVASRRRRGFVHVPSEAAENPEERTMAVA